MINVGIGAAVGGIVGKGTRLDRVGIIKVGNIRADGDGLGVPILNGVEAVACDEPGVVGNGGDWQAPTRPATAEMHRVM